MRELQVLNDGAELTALTVGEDARNFDVEGIARNDPEGALFVRRFARQRSSELSP